MKTGFNNAFVNIPGTKYYSYHGFLMPCNIQPDPSPFEIFPNTYTTCIWEIVYDLDFESPGTFFIHYQPDKFYPSSDSDFCLDKFPGGKQRYYYAEVRLLNRFTPANMVIIWNSGFVCNFENVSKYGTELYHAWFGKLWAGSSTLIMTTPARLPSHLTVWRTVCGEFNPNWPVPPT